MKSDKISGSRDANGNALIVNWNDDKMKVNRNNPDNHNDNWRPRQEVSKKKSHFLWMGFLNEKYYPVWLSQIFYPSISHFGEFLQIKFQFNVCFLIDYIQFVSNAKKSFQRFNFYPSEIEKSKFIVFWF